MLSTLSKMLDDIVVIKEVINNYDTSPSKQVSLESLKVLTAYLCTVDLTEYSQSVYSIQTDFNQVCSGLLSNTIKEENIDSLIGDIKAICDNALNILNGLIGDNPISRNMEVVAV